MLVTKIIKQLGRFNLFVHCELSWGNKLISVSFLFSVISVFLFKVTLVGYKISYWATKITCCRGPKWLPSLENDITDWSCLEVDTPVNIFHCLLNVLHTSTLTYIIFNTKNFFSAMLELSQILYSLLLYTVMCHVLFNVFLCHVVMWFWGVLVIYWHKSNYF